jgi:hypothetical protein
MGRLSTAQPQLIFVDCTSPPQELSTHAYSLGQYFQTSTLLTTQGGKESGAFIEHQGNPVCFGRSCFMPTPPIGGEIRRQPQSDPLLQCALCIRPSIEDEQHLFWSCPYAQRLWSWVSHLLLLQTHNNWNPSPEHALLGNNLPHHIRHWQHWWDLLRDLYFGTYGYIEMPSCFRIVWLLTPRFPLPARFGLRCDCT